MDARDGRLCISTNTSRSEADKIARIPTTTAMGKPPHLELSQKSEWRPQIVEE